jgi:hypothetical protein
LLPQPTTAFYDSHINLTQQIYISCPTTFWSSYLRTLNKLKQQEYSTQQLSSNITMSADAPPSYEAATGSSSQAPAPTSAVPSASRRSMEDEGRPLPPGWSRQYDSKSEHQFFVDTTKQPPRSIWHHPYDDEEYLSTLPPEESRKITRKVLTESGMDEENINRIESDTSEPKGLKKYARHLKDRITHSTHEERVADRQKQAEESQKRAEKQREADRKAYEMHLAYRQALTRAQETGQPQYAGKDKNGYDVYIEPPYGPQAPPGAVGFNPYSQGPYTNPNARFIRPDEPYSRPQGYGYGAGLGLPLLGAAAGGLLFTSLLF